MNSLAAHLITYDDTKKTLAIATGVLPSHF